MLKVPKKHHFINIKLYLLLILAIFMQSCATPYQSYNMYNGGYSEVQLDENMFKVSFNGNEATSIETAEDFTLLRSAELTLLHNYNYFIIVDSKTRINSSSYTTPTTHQTTFDAYGNARTTSYGGNTYTTSSPSTTNVIVCFKEKPKNIVSYNAKFIFKSIKKKYNILDTNYKAS